MLHQENKLFKHYWTWMYKSGSELILMSLINKVSTPICSVVKCNSWRDPLQKHNFWQVTLKNYQQSFHVFSSQTAPLVSSNKIGTFGAAHHRKVLKDVKLWQTFVLMNYNKMQRSQSLTRCDTKTAAVKGGADTWHFRWSRGKRPGKHMKSKLPEEAGS